MVTRGTQIQLNLNGSQRFEGGNGKLPCPFVKWVGGKRFLAKELIAHMPEKFKDYYEPFIGGGALFFTKYKEFTRAYLSDSNFDLMVSYKVIQKNPHELIELLREHEKKHDKKYYYEIRGHHDYNDPIQIAARFLYLNKTCYNGLWRVNKSGHFNVPIGTYKNPNIVQETNIFACHEALKCAIIEYKDFEKIRPKENDFVYFDPPYHPRDEISFTTYTESDFTEKDQERLMKFARKLTKSGVKVMLSNSNTKYINVLYGKNPFKIDIVNAPRMVNCKPNGRDAVEEVLITSY